MGTESLLTLAKRLCRNVGVSVVDDLSETSTSANQRQLVEIINETGREIAHRHDWSYLTQEVTHTTVATASQGAMSTIVGSYRKIVDDTMWNRTRKLPIYGPMHRKLWALRKAMGTSPAWSEYRIRQGNLYIYPIPSASQTVAFEVVNDQWCANSTFTTFYDAFQTTTNKQVFPDDLFLLGMKWKWFKAKGLAYAEDFEAFEQRLKQAISDDAGRRVLNMEEPEGGLHPGISIPPLSWSL